MTHAADALFVHEREAVFCHLEKLISAANERGGGRACGMIGALAGQVLSL